MLPRVQGFISVGQGTNKRSNLVWTRPKGPRCKARLAFSIIILFIEPESRGRSLTFINVDISQVFLSRYRTPIQLSSLASDAL